MDELDGIPSRLSGEIYLLILDFLERSPCRGSAEELKRELSRNGLVPPRYDWLGVSHPRSMEDFSQEYSLLSPNPLVRLLKGLIEGEEGGRDFQVPSLFLRGKRRKEGTPSKRSLLHRLQGKELGFSPSKKELLSELAPSLKCLRRTLGHLSSVFCVLFDRTGTLIFTGADDLLVKCWSLRNGRLLYTFRGASSEISDLAVSHDNRLLAAGSCDKIVRVWCLFSAAPVAILAKQHGLITAVSFCPFQNENRMYLAFTSGEGAVSFWGYAYNEFGKAVFEEAPTKYLEKIRPGGAQMICASFSPGGIFYCVGSVDHHVRVYKMDCPEGPQRILEDNAHTDRVDSIQWCHGSGLRFISGSKDGTARIWSYGCLKWTSEVLKMSDDRTVQTSTNAEGSTDSLKKVTMVAWSLDDTMAITAVSDNSIRLWNSQTGEPIGSLLGHSNEIYVMEPHPICSSILLSAAHDGRIMMWNLNSKKCLMKYNNTIPSEENAALYDAKWTPDGTCVAATDSLGHLLILGYGSSDPFNKLPKELFFHTDYRPLLRDSFHNVVDEQTQLPPHLLPSPFLVDSEGFPYHPPIQRLVRGREHLANSEALVPRGPEPSFNINNSLQVPNNNEVDPEAEAANVVAGNLLQEAQALAFAAVGDNNRFINNEDSNPGREDLQEDEDAKTFNRFILDTKDSTFNYIIIRSLEIIKEFAKFECNLFQADREKYLKDHDYLSIASINSKKNNSVRKKVTASQRRSRPASPDKEDLESDEDMDQEEDEGNVQTSDCSLDDSDFSSVEETSSDEASFCNDHSDWGSENETGSQVQAPGTSSSSQPKKRSPNKKGSRNAAQKCREQMLLSAPGGDLADVYIPSAWLSESIPRKTPYFPQIGDVLMYFKRGHEKYLDLVRDRKTYIINMKEQTWIKKKLSESVMAKIIGIQFEIKPPRLAVLKFQILNQSTGNPSGETFTLKYHDMNDVVDFLVLYQTYSASTHEWSCGDRIRCQIDDCWWKGTVKAIGPETSTSGACTDDSKFLSILCHWDNGEKEFLSPWDLEELTEETLDIPDGTAVTPEQLKSCLYKPTIEEWNDVGRDIETKRISEALETIMGLSKAEPFNYPVDQSVYPEYFYSVEYPMDLSLIKARVDNNFYRRIAAIEYDLKYVYENAEAFNLPKSDIVKSAKVIMMLAVQIINDPGKTKEDVSEIYHNLVQDFQWSSSSDEEEMDEDFHSKLNAVRSGPESLNPKKWKQDCSVLLKRTFTQPFSAPFREPVSEIDFPDYHRFITTPIDLSSIKESLHIGNYSSPIDFQKDIQLMISNSREFNTNPKSKILIMTNQLEDWIGPKILDLISNWKKTNRRLTLARRKHKIKKGERSKPEESSDPGPSGKGKGVGKGKSNHLTRKVVKKETDYREDKNGRFFSSSSSSNEEEESHSNDDDKSFNPPRASSSSKRKTPVKKQVSLPPIENDSEDEDDASPLTSRQLRKKPPKLAFNESESCSEGSPGEEEKEEETKPKPQRSAKPKTKLPSPFSSDNEASSCPTAVAAAIPGTSGSRSLINDAQVPGSSLSLAPGGSESCAPTNVKSTVVTQVSRSGRVVRKSAWKDYTYSDGDEEESEEEDVPLSRGRGSKSSKRPTRKVTTKVPIDDSDEDEMSLQPKTCRRRQFPSVKRKKKKQSEESVSESSETPVEEDSEDPALSEEQNTASEEEEENATPAPKRKSQVRTSSKRRRAIRPTKYREEDDEDEEEEEEEESANGDEDFVEEEEEEESTHHLSQRNGLRSSRRGSSKKASLDDSDEVVKMRTSTRKRKKRSLSSNSSEQENRRPLRRAAALVKKLKEQSSSSNNSNNELSSEDEETLASRRRKKPRVI